MEHGPLASRLEIKAAALTDSVRCRHGSTQMEIKVFGLLHAKYLPISVFLLIIAVLLSDRSR